MEVGHRRTNLEEQRFGFLEFLGVLADRAVAQVVQGDRQNLGRRIEEGHAAGLQLLDVLRLEQQVPGIHRGVLAQHGLDLLRVVADADGTPHVGEGVLVARVGNLDGLHQVGVEVLPVRQLGLVQRLVDAGLDLLGQEVVGRHHDVVTGLAGQELGFQGLVGVEDVVDDLDAGFLGELLDGIRGDVVRPVVDVQYLVFSLRHAGHGARQGHGEQCFTEGLDHAG